MREGTEGVISLKDIKPKVFEILLHFVYADELPKYSKPNRRFVLMKDEKRKKKKGSTRVGDLDDDGDSDVSLSDLESDSEDFDDNDDEEEEDRDEEFLNEESRVTTTRHQDRCKRIRRRRRVRRGFKSSIKAFVN